MGTRTGDRLSDLTGIIASWMRRAGRAIVRRIGAGSSRTPQMILTRGRTFGPARLALAGA
jgi:hypothetical protein